MVTLAGLPGASRGEAAYGVIHLGPMQMALPLDVLREVIPCPERFSGLPAAAPGLLGAVGVRGKVVPVLDLRPLLGLQVSRQSDQVVVLLRHAGRVLGLLADGVGGLTRPPAATLNAMDGSAGPDAAAPGRLLFCSSFERVEDGAIVSVLDVAALMRLPGLPLLRDDAAAAGGSAAGATTPRSAPTSARPLMLARCGDLRLAVDVTEIHTTLPRVTLLPSPLVGRVCRGVIEHAGLRLPAVDPLALMALGALPEDEACEALLLRCPNPEANAPGEGGLVALLVSRVVDIVHMHETELLPLSPLALRRPEMFRAALCVPGHGEHLVLAKGALQGDAELCTLASLNIRPVTQGQGSAGRPAQSAARGHSGEAAALNAATPAVGVATARAHAVITYDIGVEVATRLTQVSEVLPLPSDFARLASDHQAVMGLFTHRGHAVTLICLSSLLRGSELPDPAHARVLLVNLDGGRLGFVVPRLCNIEHTVWEQVRGTAASPRESPLGQHAVVELGEGARRRTLQLIDLRALVRSMLKGDSRTADEEMPAVAVAR